MKTLFGYVGRLGSGKGYCMMQEVEKLKTTGNSIYMVSFADPIKRILRDSFGLTKAGRINKQLPELSELYIKGQIVDSLYNLIKPLKYEKFSISEHDAKAFIARNYEIHEMDFCRYLRGATTGLFFKEDHPADYNLCFRRLGQLLGTELGRHVIDTIWIDIAFNKVQTVFKHNLADYAFIDDCRFLNEYDAFNSFKETTAFDSKIIGIQACDATRAKRRGMSIEELKAQDEHGSEKEIDLILTKLSREDIIVND